MIAIRQVLDCAPLHHCLVIRLDVFEIVGDEFLAHNLAHHGLDFVPVGTAASGHAQDAADQFHAELKDCSSRPGQENRKLAQDLGGYFGFFDS